MSDSTRMQTNDGNNIISELVEEGNPAIASIRNKSMILEKIQANRESNIKVFHHVSPGCPAQICPWEQTRSEASSNLKSPSPGQGSSLFIGADTPGTMIQSSRAAMGDTCKILASLPWAVLGYLTLILSSLAPPGLLLFERASPPGHPRHHRAQGAVACALSQS